MYIDHNYKDGLTKCTKYNARPQRVRIINFSGKNWTFVVNGRRTLSALLRGKILNNDFRRIRTAGHSDPQK